MELTVNGLNQEKSHQKSSHKQKFFIMVNTLFSVASIVVIASKIGMIKTAHIMNFLIGRHFVIIWI